jgi:fused signal recognition particle receptor
LPALFDTLVLEGKKMFGFIKEKIKKVYQGFTAKISSVFFDRNLDEEFLKDLRTLLISADTGVKTTNTIIDKLANDIKNKKVATLEEAKIELEKLLIEHLQKSITTEFLPRVLLLVGVNGSGKTTCAGKLANMLKQQNKKVILVAGDTFRAAATQQLCEWAKRVGVEIFVGRENQDPASVIFDACKKFKEGNFDHIIIDTAGRLQTKVNLMRELEKIRKIIDKQLPEEKVFTWLTVDSMIGQNSFTQADLFHQSTKLDGLVLTKLDGTGKGGIVFSITEQLHLPIVYITYGEALDEIKKFDAQEYVTELVNG